VKGKIRLKYREGEATPITEQWALKMVGSISSSPTSKNSGPQKGDWGEKNLMPNNFEYLCRENLERKACG